VAQPRSGTLIPASNPYQDDATAIRNGEAIFRARCASCHGRDARGLTGPDLTGLWTRGATDAELFQTVQRGVPGTEMPPFDTRAQLTEVWETLAYLRTRNVTDVREEVATGDAANGERLFRVQCSACHMVKGSGGILGPDLSRIGSSRPRAVLAAKIRGTSSTMVSGYDPVTLVTASGQSVRGVKKNEDDFSIQIMDMRGRLQGYVKSTLSKLTYETQSMMPVYGPDRLSDGDLDDLLRYLGTLRIAGTRR
jgi:putative heme-binding domain-containing protein